MKKLLLVFFVLSYVSSFSQETLKRSEYELTPLKGIVYFKEFSFEMKIRTNGFAIAFNKGVISRYDLTKYYHFEIGYMPHVKERPVTRYLPGFEGLSSYTFGKQNYFFNLKGGIGRKYFLSEKARRKGVAVGYSFEGGANLGLLKPYFLVLEYSDELEQTFRSEPYSLENAELFLDVNKIRDSGRFFEGFDQLQIVPGLHANAASHFALGAYEEFVRAIEIGLEVDVYLNKVPIMVETELHKNSFLFASFYVNVLLGKRSR